MQFRDLIDGITFETFVLLLLQSSCSCFFFILNFKLLHQHSEKKKNTMERSEFLLGFIRHIEILNTTKREYNFYLYLFIQSILNEHLHLFFRHKNTICMFDGYETQHSLYNKGQKIDIRQQKLKQNLTKLVYIGQSERILNEHSSIFPSQKHIMYVRTLHTQQCIVQ